eukprot:g9380.t1
MATADYERDRKPRASSRKPCRFFHRNDCFRGDKCHMVHVPKHTLPPCETHRFWTEDPWGRPACKWGDDCTWPHPKPMGVEDPELLRTNVALQTENSQISRVREYVVTVLGKGGAATATGVARSGTSRYRQKLALLEARDPEEFSRRCVSDPSLCRSLLRVYLLGGGVSASLEDAGKAVSEAVAAGNFPGGGLPVEGDGADVANPAVGASAATPGHAADSPPRLPLRVRVQALPKVMERQLIDEDSTFWGSNFPNLTRERQVGAFTHVLSVVFTRGAYLWGLAEAATHGRSIIENNNEDTAVCRAFYKITEVYARAELSFGEDWTAIDIGAAPGGWTSFLASKCRRVLSVDPAELDPAVLALPNVVHVRRVIQAATGVLRGLLAAASSPPTSESAGGGTGQEVAGDIVCRRGESGGVNSSSDGICPAPPNPNPNPPPATPAAAVGSVVPPGAAGRVRAAPGSSVVPTEIGGGAELVVSDMNAEPTVVADVLLSSMAAGLARPGAVLVATLKDFCGRHKKMRDEVASAVARLQAGTAAGVVVVGDDGGDGGVEGLDAEGAKEAGNSADCGFTSGSNEAVGPAAAAGRACSQGGAGKAGAEGGVRGDCCTPPIARGGGWWRLEEIETMKLLSGGQTEVTIIARVAYEDAADAGRGGGGGGKVVGGSAELA